MSEVSVKCIHRVAAVYSRSATGENAAGRKSVWKAGIFSHLGQNWPQLHLQSSGLELLIASQKKMIVAILFPSKMSALSRVSAERFKNKREYY